MRILLTNGKTPVNSPFFLNEKRPPIGLLYLASVLREHGDAAYLWDDYSNPQPMEDFMGLIEREHIQFVGIYCSTACWNDCIEKVYKVDFLRKRKGVLCKIILGGPHMAVCPPDKIPMEVDHVVIGEGERAIIDIVNGTAKDRIIDMRGKRITDLDSLPFPAYDLVAKKPYYAWDSLFFKESPVFTMNTSRACPYPCRFCSVKGIWGREWTSFSAERVVKDIEQLMKDFGAKAVYFREDNFTVDKKRVEKICDLLIEKGIKISWACESRTDTLNQTILTKMAQAGCKGLYIGVESGSTKMLKAIDKYIPKTQTKKMFDLCKKLGIKTAMTIMYGLPGETEGDRKLNQEFVDELKPNFYWPCVFVGQPGSPMYDEILEKKSFAFKDSRGYLYLKGHDEMVESIYKHNPQKQITHIPDTGPLVSVCMVAGKSSVPFFKKAVQSIMDQNYNNFELLIMDTTGNWECVTQIHPVEANPKVFQGQPYNKARNFLAKQAKGKYIAVMDGDDLSHLNRLRTQVEFMEKNPDVAVVGTSYYRIDAADKYLSIVPVITDSVKLKEGLKQQNWFGHSSTMIRKSCFDAVGGYDENFEFAQDYNLWVRLSKKYRIANLSYPLYSYRVHSRAVSQEKRKLQDEYAQKARALANS